MNSYLRVSTVQPPDAMPREQIDQKLIDAVVDFIRGKLTGCLEVHFFEGGVAKVIAKPVKTYK